MQTRILMTTLLVVAALAAPAGASTDSPWSDGHPHRTLRYGTPAQAGLVATHLDRIDGQVQSGMQPQPTHPRFPGAVALVARRGVIAEHDAYGHALLYADDRSQLPPQERVAMRRDTIFDLASISKLFTGISVVRLIEQGRVELEAPVARYVPEFAHNGKGAVTVRQLLTHTSGLPAWKALYSEYETREERLAAVLGSELDNPPGAAYVYSDLGYIALGVLVERVSGASLDDYVAANITRPLAMDDTMYNPPPELADRIAATEYQPWTGRGMVRGSVHDENAWSLGGVAGHAGVFSTARDMAVLAQALLNGGRYGRQRVLGREAVELMMANYNSRFAGQDHGLGFELYQHWYMDALATPFSAGHTGYTGTSLTIDPTSQTIAILFTNRVHPSRSWGTINPWRRALSGVAARAVAVRPAAGDDAWFSGLDDGATDDLLLPLELPAGRKRLEFALWYDTEPGTDAVRLEASPDGGRTWQALQGTVRRAGSSSASQGVFTGYSGRVWHHASFALDAASGAVLLRWRYQTDALYHGRGAYVDDVRIAGPRGAIFDGEHRDAKEVWRASGWTPAED
jgi:CubicO group peptidase (beta-lactamase class C family)